MKEIDIEQLNQEIKGQATGDVIPDEGDNVRDDEYLLFVSDKEVYAVEIQYVSEIIGVPQITELPNVQDYVKGLINLRGKFIPMMDVRIRLQKSEIDYTEKTCTIVVDFEEYTVGLIVDAVSDVAYISEDMIVQPPDNKASYYHKFIKGIWQGGDEDTEYSIIFIVDLKKLLDRDKDGEDK